MRQLVGQSIKGGLVGAFNQKYKLKLCGDVLKFLARELKIEGNVCHIIEAYMKYKNDHSKIFREEN